MDRRQGDHRPRLELSEGGDLWSWRGRVRPLDPQRQVCSVRVCHRGVCVFLCVRCCWARHPLGTRLWIVLEEGAAGAV